MEGAEVVASSARRTAIVPASDGFFRTVIAAVVTWSEQVLDGWRLVSGRADDPEHDARLIVEIGSAGIRLIARERGGAERVVADLGAARPDEVVAVVRRFMATSGGRAPTLGLGFADEICVDADVVMPHASRSILDRAAEMRAAADQPFPDDDGLAFWSITRRPADGAHVRIVFVPAEPARAVAAALRDDGLELSAVQRRGERPFFTRPTWLGSLAAGFSPIAAIIGFRPLWVALVAFGLILGSVLANIAVSGARLWSMADDVAAAGAGVEQLQRVEAARRFLAARQHEGLARIAVLDGLAKRLPDGTWLSAAEIKGDRIEFTGFAPSAGDALRHVAGVEHVRAVEHLSAVTRDDASAVERFRIGGQIVPDRSKFSAGGRP